MKSRGLARLALLIIPVAAAAAPAALPQLARAATTIAVTTTSDDLSANCLSANPCSLRSAVTIANNDNNGDIIQLSANTYDLTILADPNASPNDDGSAGDLELLGNMTIKGAGATKTLIRGVGESVSGSFQPWNDRIIEVENQSNTPTVTITDLKISGGNANVNTGPNEGDGGGVYNSSGNLTLHNVFVDGNISDSDGGGVASNTSSARTTTITNSTISTNTAANNGGGLFIFGVSTAVQSFSNLLITNNIANGSNQVDAGGGGIYNDFSDRSGTGGTVFSDLMVLSNHAPGMGGGGVYDNSLLANPARSAVYQRITLASNDAQIVGGGFYQAGGSSTLTNATVNANAVKNSIVVAVVGNGGGLAAGRSGTITVNNATINGNSSPGPGGGAATLNSGDIIHFHNTILVKNTPNNCLKTGTIDSTGYNIVDDLTCALGKSTDREGTSFNPNLIALANNTGPYDGSPLSGSPTLTEALPKNSIAVDTADPTAANNPSTDERGVARPQGIASDVGAYELIPPPFVQPVLPAAGHPAGSGPSPAFWAILALVGATALGASRLGARAGS